MEINITYEAFDDISSLNDQDTLLVNKAIEASKSAYAKYSNFQVGAALLLESGDIILGNNQENIAYPSGICAERTALFYAGSNYPNQKILSLAIYGVGELLKGNGPVTPCGSCRQVIAESIARQNSGFELILIGANGKIAKFKNALDLLPLPFGL